ncbi:hypothetical protein VTK73DRAFT_1996 [Phialemonium thermophilum]|uniref:Uncharacterized protein n=1 Tax=Phialemonium thermophilum TaxID=223376 RepID=A0ABR3VSU3_9PEZI
MRGWGSRWSGRTPVCAPRLREAGVRDIPQLRLSGRVAWPAIPRYRAAGDHASRRAPKMRSDCKAGKRVVFFPRPPIQTHARTHTHSHTHTHTHTLTHTHSHTHTHTHTMETPWGVGTLTVHGPQNGGRKRPWPGPLFVRQSPRRDAVRQRQWREPRSLFRGAAKRGQGSRWRASFLPSSAFLSGSSRPSGRIQPAWKNGSDPPALPRGREWPAERGQLSQGWHESRLPYVARLECVCDDPTELLRRAIPGLSFSGKGQESATAAQLTLFGSLEDVPGRDGSEENGGHPDSKGMMGGGSFLAYYRRTRTRGVDGGVLCGEHAHRARSWNGRL